MDYFSYKKGVLHVENIPVPEIANSIGTPFYCYSHTCIQENFIELAKAVANSNTSIFFAVKSNSNIAIIKLLSELGAGADVVSEGEIRRALAAGIPGEKIIFSGVGKTQKEIAYALESKVYQINIESEEELNLINKTSIELNKLVNVAFRINPDVDVNTHEKITTGKKENKFGIPWPYAKNIFLKAEKMQNINVTGLAIHIGSQLLDLKPLDRAFNIAIRAATELLDLGINIRNIDFGGGLGVNYIGEKPPNLVDYANIIKKNINNKNFNIFIEPGRRIVANGGILITKVIYKKNNGDKKFVIIDAAMNDLLRPSLYDAKHKIRPILEKTNSKLESFDVVGPICESGDVLAKDITLPEEISDELLAIYSAGAYGSVMSSNYNSRLMIPEVLVKDQQFSVIRKRQTYDELLSNEKFADWQTI